MDKKVKTGFTGKKDENISHDEMKEKNNALCRKTDRIDQAGDGRNGRK